MEKININKNQFSDLLNLINNVFFPLKKFVNQKEFNEILKRKYMMLPIQFNLTFASKL